MKLKNHLRLVLLLLSIILIYESQVAEGCSARLLRAGRNIFREIYEDITTDKTKKHSPKKQNEAKTLTEEEKKYYTRILPDDEYYQEDSEFKMPIFYTDFVGCYESGRSQDYRGRLDYTETHRKCSRWNTFTTEIRGILRTMTNKTKTSFNWTKLEKTKEEKEEEEKQMIGITIINETIKILRSKNYVFHNYCRDPDGVGKPWCFVVSKEGVLEWEYCALPVCTPCWRLRQRGFPKQFDVFSIVHDATSKTQVWVPECTLEGKFHHTQCWEKYCWCSTSSGTIIKNTLRPKKRRLPNCGELSMTKEHQKKKTKKSPNPEDLIRNYHFPMAEKPKIPKTLKPKKNTIEKVHTKISTRMYRNKFTSRTYTCKLHYFYTRELECTGEDTNTCWFSMKRNLYSLLCMRKSSKGSNSWNIIEFKKTYCAKKDESFFTGGKWIYRMDNVTEKCRMLVPADLRIRFVNGQRFICYYFHGPKKNETCNKI